MDHFSKPSEAAPLIDNAHPKHFLLRKAWVLVFIIALCLFVILLIILGATGLLGGGNYKFMYSSYYSSEWVSPYYPATFELETDGKWHAVGWSTNMEYQYVSGEHSSKLVLNLRCVATCTSTSIDDVSFKTSIEIRNGECLLIYSDSVYGYGTYWQQACWTNKKCQDPCPSTIDSPPSSDVCWCQDD